MHHVCIECSSAAVTRIKNSGSGSSGTCTSRSKRNPAFSYARIAATFFTDGPITHTSNP